MSTDLITEHLDLWTRAATYNRGEPELTGIAKLWELILGQVPGDCRPQYEPTPDALPGIAGVFE